MSFLFGKKKQSPPKKKPLSLSDISILLQKTKEYFNLDRQKKINECLQCETRLCQMLKAPQRNRKDEEVQILKIGNLLNQIEAYEKASILISNLDQMKGQITSCNGDAQKIQSIIPYVASICFYIEKANDLRGAVDLKTRMNEYFGCDVANTFDKSVDPQAKTLYYPINIQSPVIQKYAQDFSKKYQILDVPGLPYNPIQQSSSSQGGFPQPSYPNSGYPSNSNGGGFGQQQQYQCNYPSTQQQQQMYPQQQSQQQQLYPQQQLQQTGGFPNQQSGIQQNQQNGYPNQQQGYPNVQQPQQPLNYQFQNPYAQITGPIYQNNPNQYLPQIIQPNIGVPNRSSSNFDYPQQSNIIKPPENKQNAQTFLPLTPTSQQTNNQQQQPNPFEKLDSLKNQAMTELPAFQQIPTQSQQNNLNQNMQQSQKQQNNVQQSQNNQNQNNLQNSQNPYLNQQYGQQNDQLQRSQSNNPYISLQQQQQQNSQLQRSQSQQNNQQQNIQSNEYNQGNNNYPSYNQYQDNQGQIQQLPSYLQQQEEFSSQNLAHLKNPLESNIGGILETKTLNEEIIENSSDVVGVVITNHDIRSLEILRSFNQNKGSSIQDSKQIIETILREI